MAAIARMAAATLVFALMTLPGAAEEASAPVDGPVAAPLDKAAVETIVHDYLLANPEILEQAFQVLQAKKQQAEATAHEAAIADSRELIFDSTNQAVLGNPDGKITLVEFFDYNCGYCRRAVSDMTALLDANPDLRIVMKEFPILSEGSVEAARVSVAVKDLEPARYQEFHTELFTRPGEATAAKALEVAADLGLDVEALKAAAAKPEVTANITEVHKLATALGIGGTPSYVIGSELVPGAIGYDGLQAKVEAVRQCGATVC